MGLAPDGPILLPLVFQDTVVVIVAEEDVPLCRVVATLGLRQVRDPGLNQRVVPGVIDVDRCAVGKLDLLRFLVEFKALCRISLAARLKNQLVILGV